MNDLYDTDFALWTEQQAQALHRRAANEIDWDNDDTDSGRHKFRHRKKRPPMQGALAIGAAICAFLTIASPQAKAQGQGSVTIMQGAVVCLSHGDLVVFVNSGAMMPGCRRLALDTPSVQAGPVDHGMVPVRAGASTWWVLEASIRRH